MGIGDVELGEDETHGPGVRDGCSACHEDDEGALAANEVDQELQEGVDGEGLVDVAEGIDPGGGLDRHQTAPGGSGVDGHPGRLVREGSRVEGRGVHEEDAHDISLEQRLAVVLAAAGSVSEQVSSLSRTRTRTRTSHYLRLQPHSSGRHVSGQAKQSTARQTTHMKVTKLATRAHTPAAMMMAWPSRWPVPPSMAAGCVSWTVPAAMAETGLAVQCSAVQCSALAGARALLVPLAGGEMAGGRGRGLQISSQRVGSGALNGRRRPWRATAHRLRAFQCDALRCCRSRVRLPSPCVEGLRPACGALEAPLPPHPMMTRIAPRPLTPWPL